MPLNQRKFNPLPRIANVTDPGVPQALVKSGKMTRRQPWNASNLTTETDRDRISEMRKSVERLSSKEGMKNENGEIYVQVKLHKIPLEKI